MEYLISLLNAVKALSSMRCMHKQDRETGRDRERQRARGEKRTEKYARAKTESNKNTIQ